jgi:hypothetical protein
MIVYFPQDTVLYRWACTTQTTAGGAFGRMHWLTELCLVYCDVLREAFRKPIGTCTETSTANQDGIPPMSSPAYDLSGSLYGLFPIGPSFLGIAPSLAYRWTCIAIVVSLNLGVSPSNYDLVSALNTRDYLGSHR